MRSGGNSFAKGRRVHHGFTLLELITSIAVIAVLLALLLPAVSAAREAARRSQCAGNLRQMATALTNYEATHAAFPGLDFKYSLLPYLDLQNLYEQRLPNGTGDGPYAVYSRILLAEIPVYVCPSESIPARCDWATGANYMGCSGTGVLESGLNGLFHNGLTWPGGMLAHNISPKDVTDGLSNTAAFSEALLGPITGTAESLLRMNVETPTSYTVQADLVAFCDSIPDDFRSYGYRAGSLRGWPWVQGSYMIGLYSHGQTPNRPACQNKTHLVTGILGPSSGHSGTVRVAFADGSVRVVSNEIDASVWKSLGSIQEMSVPSY
jgi:prepilin-type N-terminal cleavage/methylation domain-containing protein/prepilin-type processing-associated H-X9-DG protein